MSTVSCGCFLLSGVPGVPGVFQGRSMEFQRVPVDSKSILGV